MEEALLELTSMRPLAGLSLLKAILDETTFLNFRHMLEKDELARVILSTVNAHLAREGWMVQRGTMVGVTIIAASSRIAPTWQVAVSRWVACSDLPQGNHRDRFSDQRATTAPYFPAAILAD